MLEGEQLAGGYIKRFGNCPYVFERRVTHASFHARQVCYMNACAVRDFFLRETNSFPQ